MTNLSKLALATLMATLLIACGAKEEPTGVIPEGQLKAMEKAKDVENILQDAQKKQMEEIDKQG